MLSWDMGGMISLTREKGRIRDGGWGGKMWHCSGQTSGHHSYNNKLWAVSCYSKLSFITRSMTCFMHEALVIILLGQKKIYVCLLSHVKKI
jgi:hypothetical protein